MASPKEIVEKARSSFHKGRMRPYEFRMKQLEQLQKMCTERRSEIAEAVEKDLKKCQTETVIGELSLTEAEIKYAMVHLKRWMEPDIPSKTLITVFDKLRVYKQPRGVVLVIAPWNYPVLLIMMPLIGAIAAGNCVIIKPSEIAPCTAEKIAELIPQYLDRACYHVFLGGIAETTELLKERFDHIMYTGSAAVGKIVRAASNQYLTPVTLELGGKNPLYLDQTVDMKIAVQRILWGKLLNTGQTCLAPDYILCDKNTEHEFLARAREVLKLWYGENPKMSPDLARIINGQHFRRINELLKTCNIAVGGETDPSDLFIEPTIVTNVTSSDPIMQEEIFGPVLAILTVKDINEAIDFINRREHPLAIYVFSQSKKVQDLILTNTSSGSVLINDTLLQFAVETMPFGGVGNSGMGVYRGKYSFDTFSHKKSCISKDYSFLVEKASSVRYPPYNKHKQRVMEFFLDKSSFGEWIKYVFIAFLSMGLFILASLFQNMFFP